ARTHGAEFVDRRPPRPPGRSACDAGGRGHCTARDVRGGRARRPRTVSDPRRRSRRAARRLPAGVAGMNTVFDPRQVRRAFSRASASYDAAATLQHEVEARLLESLDYLEDRVPETVLDLGSGPGHAAAAMRKR